MSLKPPPKKTKSTFLSTRVPLSVRKQFHKAAGAHGGASVVLRELIEGFIEHRVKIAPPAINREGSLYHVD